MTTSNATRDESPLPPLRSGFAPGTPGFTRARNTFVAAHVGLAFVIGARYAARNPCLDKDDAIQTAAIGLIFAGEYFDPSRGVKFSTLAFSAGMRRCADLRRRELRRLDRITTDAEAMAQVVRAPDKADAMGEDERHKLNVALRRLTPLDRRVLRDRFGLGRFRERTLAEIGSDLGVTRERVRQIEHRALNRLRSLFKAASRLPHRRGSARSTRRNTQRLEAIV